MHLRREWIRVIRSAFIVIQVTQYAYQLLQDHLRGDEYKYEGNIEDSHRRVVWNRSLLARLLNPANVNSWHWAAQSLTDASVRGRMFTGRAQIACIVATSARGRMFTGRAQIACIVAVHVAECLRAGLRSPAKTIHSHSSLPCRVTRCQFERRQIHTVVLGNHWRKLSSNSKFISDNNYT